MHTCVLTDKSIAVLLQEVPRGPSAWVATQARSGRWFLLYVHRDVLEGTALWTVSLSVCLSVCVLVCVSVSACVKEREIDVRHDHYVCVCVCVSSKTQIE
jgi:hypothetical protein